MKSDIRNAYKDEQKKIDDDFNTELELSFKIQELLERYGYFMEAELKSGVPVVQLTKLS